MKGYMMLAIAGGFVALAHGAALAGGAPAWCHDYKDKQNPDLKKLSDPDPYEVVEAFVHVECNPNAEVEASRAQIETARAAWGKKWGMDDADWEDAVDYLSSGARRAAMRGEIQGTPKTKDLTAYSPVDQFMLIDHSPWDKFYTTDIFGPQLSETGRFAVVRHCLGRDTEDPVSMAVCQVDIDTLDLAKVMAELHADKSHAGAEKMRIRLDALDMKARLKEHAAAVAKLKAEDEAWGKVWAAAASARKIWDDNVGKETALLALVQRMEAADYAQSRKLFDGCDETTWKMLGEQVSKIPAKTFDGMYDKRMDPFDGFGKQAIPLLNKDPRVHLAFIAVALCNQRPHLADELKAYMQDLEGSRGPRDFALAWAPNQGIQLDKVGAKIEKPRRGNKSYSRSGGAPSSAGGVIKGVKMKGDEVEVEMAPLLIKQTDCVAEHRTNKIDSIRSDGHINYEIQCDRSAVVVHDNAWAPFHLDAKYKDVLRPGLMFSAITGNKGGDVIAIWQNEKAKHPMWLFGASIK